MLGLLGKKLGMTDIDDEFGRRLAVTAIHAGPCTVLQVKEPPRHGYRAIQVGFQPVEESDVNQPLRGQSRKAGVGPFRYVREFRLGEGKTEEPAGGEGWKVGQQLTVELFQPYELVDVTGISIGKGFQGGVKRWGWKGGPQTHGSTSHRAPGSIGSTTTPGRVFRGHHLPGHMGADRVTVQNLRVVHLDPEHHLLLVAGAIPGAEQSLVMVRRSVKHPGLIKKPKISRVAVEEEERKTGKKPKAKK